MNIDVCGCVCGCVDLCGCVGIHMDVYTSMWMCVKVCECGCVWMYVWIYVNVDVCGCVCMLMSMYVNVSRCVWMCESECMQMCVCVNRRFLRTLKLSGTLTYSPPRPQDVRLGCVRYTYGEERRTRHRGVVLCGRG